MIIPPRVSAAAKSHAYPLLFATISGAHLYGFPSGDSDWDLRGCHILPAREVLGLERREETVIVEEKEADFELDLVSHDVEKFFSLLLKKNGYVLEQLYSPLVVSGGLVHDELKEIALGCITRHHVHHYLGFARNQWRLFAKESAPRVKPLLYTYRVILTGIHLMRSGRIEANLPTLLETYPIDGVRDLIAIKTQGAEKEPIDKGAVRHHERIVHGLIERLEEEGEHTSLRDAPLAREALSDLLVRLRLETV